MLIGARDGGTPPLEAVDTFTIDVDVTRRNNSVPRFEQTYSEEINATVPANTFVIRVQAVDPDPNAALTYRIACKFNIEFIFSDKDTKLWLEYLLRS